MGQFTSTMWRQHRASAITLILCGLMGVIGLGKPVDRLLTSLRYHLDPIPASGDIVAVGIDRDALTKIGAWPWDRARHAELIDNLYAAGAKRVVFDVGFSSAGTPQGNSAFSEALARNDKKTWILAIPPKQDGDVVLPVSSIADHAQMASGEARTSFSKVAVSYDAAEYIQGKPYPSLPVVLAGEENKLTDIAEITVNYAIDADSIPYLSAADVIQGRLPHSLRGKTILVGANDNGVGDIFSTPNGGYFAGMFAAILGAETLMRGKMVALGWLPAMLFAGFAAFAISRVRSRKVKLASMVAVGAGLLLAPYALTYFNISAEVAPALTTFIALPLIGRFAKMKKQALEEEFAGIGSVALAEQDGLENKAAIVCLVVANDAQMRATLTPKELKKIWDNLYQRISFTIGKRPLYRQANCLFWGLEQSSYNDIKDQLTGLHALLHMSANPETDGVRAEGFFGVDMQSNLPLRARIAGAMDAIQRADGERVVCNDPVDRAETLWGLTLSSEISKGLSRGDFWVAYQPQIATQTGDIVGVEALIRWTHPERGFLSPLDFIEAAEKSGDLSALTEFVLKDVAGLMVSTSKHAPTLQWSVNVSPRQLVEGKVGQAIARTFAEAGAEPWRLTIELTETARLSQVAEAKHELASLRALGVELSADDYGSGVSTLENLRASQVSELKIDKQFIMAIKQGNAEYHMVRSTIMMAHAMGLRVVAEGIEEREIALILRQLHCDRMQGYYFAKPMEKTEFLQLLTKGKLAA